MFNLFWTAHRYTGIHLAHYLGSVQYLRIMPDYIPNTPILQVIAPLSTDPTYAK